MFYATKQNKYIVEGTAFELDGVQYPAVWLNQATAEQKAAVGLQEVVATNSPADDRFYWIGETLDKATLTYINYPKQLDDSEEPDESGKLVKTIGLKTVWKEQVNNIVYTSLQPSDYMPARSFETGEPMNEAWKTYRADVRAYAVTVKESIDACTTVDELEAVVTNMDWPHDPNYVAPVGETDTMQSA